MTPSKQLQELIRITHPRVLEHEYRCRKNGWDHSDPELMDAQNEKLFKVSAKEMDDRPLEDKSGEIWHREEYGAPGPWMVIPFSEWYIGNKLVYDLDKLEISIFEEMKEQILAGTKKVYLESIIFPQAQKVIKNFKDFEASVPFDFSKPMKVLKDFMNQFGDFDKEIEVEEKVASSFFAPKDEFRLKLFRAICREASDIGVFDIAYEDSTVQRLEEVFFSTDKIINTPPFRVRCQSQVFQAFLLSIECLFDGSFRRKVGETKLFKTGQYTFISKGAIDGTSSKLKKWKNSKKKTDLLDVLENIKEITKCK